MKEKKRFRYLIMLLASVFVLSACSSKDKPSGAGDKVLHIVKDTDIKTLDGSLATDGISFEVLTAMTDGLIAYDKDGVVVPRIAKDWTISDDGLTLTFNLRDDAKWSNGDAVSANDFVYSWRRTVDPATKAEYALIIADAGIKNAAAITAGDLPVTDLGVAADGDHTLVVTLSASVPYILELLTFPTFYPMNEKFVTEKGDSYAKSKDDLISNGPFVLTEWTPGSSWALAKNADYYDADAVKIDGLDFKLLSDYQTAALEFDNGKVDFTKISSDLVSRYKGKDEFKQQPLGFLWYIAPNQSKPEFQNADLRLALGYAIDRDHIVNDIMADGSLAADYVVPVGLAVGPDDKDFRDTADRYLTFDLVKAQEHLDKAKEALGKSSFEFDLLIEDSQESRTNAEAIQADLAELDGLSIKITTLPKSERLDRMKAGDYELGLTRWGPDYADPYTFLGTLFTKDSPYNYARYDNPAFDTLVLKTGAGGELSTDPAARWQAFKDVEKILLDEAGIIPIWQSSDALIQSKRVSGIEMHVVGITSYRNVVIAD